MKSSKIEKEVYDRFAEALSRFPNSQLTIKYEDRWTTSLITRWFDLVIYKDTHPQAVVEIRPSLSVKNILARALDKALSGLRITNARFGIVTDNKLFHIYDRDISDQDFKPISFDDLILILVDPVRIKINNNDLLQVAEIFQEAARKHLPDSMELKLLIEKGAQRHITFDNDSNQYCFAESEGSMNAFENRLFNALFGKFTETQICRYTSLSTVHSMLNRLSYRLNGLVGMNDKTEVNYVDTYLNGVETPLVKEHPNTISALNRRFITSCSKKSNIDNLTLWRLYADDSRGACLVFDTKLRNVNSHVLLQRVKYAENPNQDYLLDFIKFVIDEVLLRTGFSFKFKKLGFWKHFFKPYEYSIEDEVRLLIVDSKSIPSIGNEWVITNPHSILNPVIEFQLNDTGFPLKLIKIILGPKCPEQETNKVQLEELIRQKKREIVKRGLRSDLTGLSVELSRITNYR